MSNEFQEITEFYPAYDKRDPDPKKNYGIHGVNLRMVLKGPLGAVQFLLFTNWQLPHITKEKHERVLSGKVDESWLRVLFEPMPADLGYHSPKPLYEGQLPMGAVELDFESTETLHGAAGDLKIPTRRDTGIFDPCEYLDGQACYYDGSSLRAENIYQVLLHEGSAGVWRELHKYYDVTFLNRET